MLPIYTHTKPGGRLKWSYAKSPGWRPFYVWPCVWSADLHLLIKSMVIHDTECPYWDQVSLNNTPNQIYSFIYIQQRVCNYWWVRTFIRPTSRLISNLLILFCSPLRLILLSNWVVRRYDVTFTSYQPQQFLILFGNFLYFIPKIPFISEQKNLVKWSELYDNLLSLWHIHDTFCEVRCP